MKKMSLAAMTVTACMVTGIGLASAASYNFSWKNNMNMFTYSNNPDAVCSNIKTEILVGNSAVASNIIPSLRANEQSSFTLNAPACTSTRFTATCTFKDYNGKKVTATKNKTDICWGGEGYLSPSPMNKSWTTFQIDYYCTPPCR